MKLLTVTPSAFSLCLLSHCVYSYRPLPQLLSLAVLVTLQLGIGCHGHVEDLYRSGHFSVPFKLENFYHFHQCTEQCDI